MRLVVSTPEGRRREWAYILGVILGDWFGVEFTHRPERRSDVSITVDGSDRRLVLPAIFLSTTEECWLQAASLPALPLAWSHCQSLFSDRAADHAEVPVIYGTQSEVLIGPNSIELPIDIMGSAFFMLTRYEELVIEERDRHDRFPAHASIAGKCGLLDRPLVDEYCEILWQSLSRLWPALIRREHTFRCLVSHDVDAPGKYSLVPLGTGLRACMADVVNRRDLASALLGLPITLLRRHSLHPADPFNTFDWLMDVSEDQGLVSAFYFICGRTDPAKDAFYDLGDPQIRHLMSRIAQRGHEVGLHPSYNTFRRPEAIRDEAGVLKDICHKEGIHQSIWGGRMHYLRWDQQVTPLAWDAAGMNYDSSLGYADQAGFRCGTCREFRFFDLGQSRQCDLMIRPLVAMERTVMDAQYMGKGQGEAAFETFVHLKSVTRRYRGDFTLLWHNSTLTTDQSRDLYRQVLAA